MSFGSLRSLSYALCLTAAVTLVSVSASAQFKGCGDIEVTTVSHEDTVVLPLHIHARTTCSTVYDLQLWVDGAQVNDAHALTLDYDLTSLSVGTHRVVVQGIDNTPPPNEQILIKSQALTVNVALPAAGMTGAVNIWNPTGCPAANSCTYAENVPSSFYVDAKVYSNQANIHNIEVWLDGVKKDENVMATLQSNAAFHSTVALNAGVGNHRLVVQATDTSSTVIAKTATYFNVTGSNLGTMSNMDDLSTNPSLGLWATCPNSWDPCQSQYYPTTFTQGSRSGVQLYADSGTWETAQRHYIWPSGSVSAPPNFSPNPNQAYNFPFKYVKYEFDLYVPTGATSLISNLEWEVQQRLADTSNGSSYVRNMAFEDNYDQYGTLEWRAYDYYVKATNNSDSVTTRWQSVGVPNLKFNENQWYHVVLESHLDESVSGVILVRHDAISAYPIGGAATRQGTNYHNSHIVPTDSSSDETTTSIQQGNNSNSGNTNTKPWSILMDNIQVTYTW